MRVPILHAWNQAAKPWRRRARAGWYTLTGRREAAITQLARTADGMFRRDEILLLYRTALAAAGPGDIAEIGSWKGRTSIILGLALRDRAEPDCRIFAIDHHQGSEEHSERIGREGSTLDTYRRNVQAAGVAARVEELVMPSNQAARVLAERGVRLRLLFIDGAHDEASVREDIRNFLPLVASRGVIALHDCEEAGGFPGVWRAYQSDLASRVEELGRASSLLVTRLRA